MLLINSHFSKNKGTTDFLVDFLVEKNKDFYLLKHPFDVSESKNVELWLYGQGQFKLMAQYKKINSGILNLLNDFFVSIFVSLKLGRDVDKVIGVGGFNVVPFIVTNLFFGRDIFFWGVDYSTKRFGNPVLSFIYMVLETVSCKFSKLTISQSPRQEEARIKHHGLKKEKSILSANGIIKTNDYNINKNIEGKELNLVYLGSITKQHGIIDFVNYFYVENDLAYKLHIIGSGPEIDVLKAKIRQAQNPEKINYLGYKNQVEIVNFLESLDAKIVGIAPYSDSHNDHVYYGDSLKLKEYLLYNIPFVTSRITYIPPDLEEFGIIYENFDELASRIGELERMRVDTVEKKQRLKSHAWDTLLTTIINKINL